MPVNEDSSYKTPVSHTHLDSNLQTTTSFEYIAIGACIFHLHGIGKPSAHNNLEVIRLHIIKLRIKTMDVNNNFVLPSPSKTKICK